MNKLLLLFPLLALQLPAAPALKDACQGLFLVGAALNESQFSEQDPRKTALLLAQFNCISPENALKWESVHPKADGYNFAAADRYVSFGEKHGLVIIGHALVWHHQTPAWVFRDQQGNPASRELLLQRMQDHIQTVVGRYKGRIKGWDVVNEALNEDGTLRDSPWLKIIGPDYIAKAFQMAHAADPQAELYYNDYSLENAPKRKGALKLLKDLQQQGVPVTAVGLQGHYKMDWPSPGKLNASLTAFSKLGLQCMITELDMDVLPAASPQVAADPSLRQAAQQKLDPYVQGLPEDVQRKLAKRYAELFAVFARHRGTLSRVTFWGLTDGDSWLNYWPIRGRTSYPLLFDRNSTPKPAFDAVLTAVSGLRKE